MPHTRHRLTLLAILACLGTMSACDERAPKDTAGGTNPAPKSEPQTPPTPAEPDQVVVIDTSAGVIVVQLHTSKAPITVKNFLEYVDQAAYDGTVFHRVIPGFMIQGGGMTPDMQRRPTRAPIRNEANNGLRNSRGTIAMARTSDIHSATSQFFINHADNRNLDHGGPAGFGYCVFGTVTEGMDVVDAIAKVRTGSRDGHQDVPVETVLINSIRRRPANIEPK